MRWGGGGEGCGGGLAPWRSGSSMGEVNGELMVVVVEVVVTESLVSLVEFFFGVLDVLLFAISERVKVRSGGGCGGWRVTVTPLPILGGVMVGGGGGRGRSERSKGEEKGMGRGDVMGPASESSEVVDGVGRREDRWDPLIRFPPPCSLAVLPPTPLTILALLHITETKFEVWYTSMSGTSTLVGRTVSFPVFFSSAVDSLVPH